MFFGYLLNFYRFFVKIIMNQKITNPFIVDKLLAYTPFYSVIPQHFILAALSFDTKMS